MTERAEPPQDSRHQPPHQGAVAIGQRLHAGMRGRSIELLVESAVLMQHAVQNIRRDPPRRKTGHLGWQCKSLGGHGAGTSRKIGWRFAFQSMPSGATTPVPRQYAKHKNRPGDFTFAASSVWQKPSGRAPERW